MNIAICDDREDDRSALKALLKSYEQDFEISEEAMEILKNNIHSDGTFRMAVNTEVKMYTSEGKPKLLESEVLY